MTTQEPPESAVETPPVGTRSFSRTPARIQTDSLLATHYIGEITQRGFKSPRAIPLQTNQLYRRLTELYEMHFVAKYDIVQNLLDNVTVPANVEPPLHLARVLISHWFIDLYVSIREACYKHDLSSDMVQYLQEIGRCSSIYDNFLVLLLNTIKPTHIIGLPHDALYVPIITSSANWRHSRRNYFNIQNFVYDSNLFGSLIRLMRSPNYGWQMHPVMTDALGRPSWLFDWHEDSAYAWFPKEDNYNEDDKTIAYIIGVSCTPTLSSADFDRPQQYPGNVKPADKRTFNYVRINGKTLPSNMDYRVIEEFTVNYSRDIPVQVTTEIPATRAATGTGETASGPSDTALVVAGTPQTQTEPETATETRIETRVTELNMFRIVDYRYYAQVTRLGDLNTRHACMKMLIYCDSV